jgi:parallel beta-helix repeat protein
MRSRHPGVAWRVLAAGALGLALAALGVMRPPAPPSDAASEGENGKIAYNEQSANGTCSATVMLIEPDGSGSEEAPFHGGEPTWSPDGTKVAFWRGDGILYVANADGSDEQALTDFGGVINYPNGMPSPSWSPDGKRLVFAQRISGTVSTDLFVIDVQTKVETRLTNDAGPRIANWAPSWRPGAGSDLIAFIRWEPDAGTASIWTVHDDGGGAAPLAEGFFLEADWSPDGTSLAAEESVIQGNGSASYIALVSYPDGGVAQLSPPHSDDEDDYYPAWSPDGSMIAFVSNRGGTQLYPWVINGDGSGAHKLTNTPGCHSVGWQLLATHLFVVNSVENAVDESAGDGTCDTGQDVEGGAAECTLRAAILESNAGAGKDTIAFNIPGLFVPSIEATTPWPDITDPVVIDGTTQPDFGKVSIQNWGLVISGGNSDVRGLVINSTQNWPIRLTGGGGNALEGNFIGVDPEGFRAAGNSSVGGILIESSDNRIGGRHHSVGVCNGDCNLISINETSRSFDAPDGDITITGSEATGNVVYGNFIGTDLTGMKLPLGGGHQQYGVVLSYYAHDNTIGSTEPVRRNVIAGFRSWAIIARNAQHNKIEGNSIGVLADGISTVLGQQNGIVIWDGEGNDVGNNVVAGFAENSVLINNPASRNNVVHDNFIGTTVAGAGALPAAAGVSALPNGEAGVRVQAYATDNTIEGNAIAFSEAGVLIAQAATNTTITNNIIRDNGAGVLIAGATGNRVSANSIHDNEPIGTSGLGIDIDPGGPNAPNDNGDFDGGPNNRQNFPVLGFAAATGGGGLRVGGTLDTNFGSRTYRIEFFANAACDGSGYGEGERYLGFADVSSDLAGRAVIDSTFPQAAITEGQFITTTATDPNGNTSEFSRCRPIESGTSLTAAARAGETELDVASNSGFQAGDVVVLCPGCTNEESGSVAGTGSLLLKEALRFDHAAAEPLIKVPSYAPRDADCSGSVDSMDMLVLLKWSAGVDIERDQKPGCPAIASDFGEATFGDANCDGGVTPIDSLIILRALAGIPQQLPCP